MEDTYRSGDVNIQTLTIHSKAGDLNAVQFVLSASIFESIFVPGIIAEIILRETKDLMNVLPIRGEETMTMTWNTPSRKDRTVQLSIMSITDAQAQYQNRSVSYILRACSAEAFNNKTTFVQKSYNTTISSIVTDLLKNELKTTKTLDVMSTKGTQKLIFSNRNVYDAIKVLQRRAVSNADKSSLYMFFESKTGIHFTTFENMLANGEMADDIFTWDPTNNVTTNDVGFRNMMAFERPKHFMTVEKIGEGALKTRVKRLDFRTLSYQKNDVAFDPSVLKSADGSYKPLNTTDFTSKFGQNAGKHVFITSDSFYPPTGMEDAAPNMFGGMSEYSQTAVKGYVYGDSQLSVGMKINTKIMQTSGDDTSKEEDPRLSGKYLITKLRHIIGPIDEPYRYTQAFEAVKGGTFK